jgi:hypothetical protein
MPPLGGIVLKCRAIIIAIDPTSLNQIATHLTPDQPPLEELTQLVLMPDHELKAAPLLFLAGVNGREG